MQGSAVGWAGRRSHQQEVADGLVPAVGLDPLGPLGEADLPEEVAVLSEGRGWCVMEAAALSLAASRFACSPDLIRTMASLTSRSRGAKGETPLRRKRERGGVGGRGRTTHLQTSRGGGWW